MKRRSFSIVALLGMSLAACSSSPRNNSSWAKEPITEVKAVFPLTQGIPGVIVTSAKNAGKGVGPVDHVDMAALDASRAAQGEQLFQAKCSACHKIAERYIGPALTGVTQRREPEWILNQILNPENMIKEDPVARALLSEYIAPMANQHLTLDEAESILVYFREHDAATAQAAAPQAGTQATPVATPTGN